jgi:hypothetical protein
MALSNAEKQRRFRERRKELAERAVTEDDSDKEIVAKLVDALGLERLQEFAKAMPRLLAAEERRAKPKKVKPPRSYSLADNESLAPGGKLQWYKPDVRWHRECAQAMVPLPPGYVRQYEAYKRDEHSSLVWDEHGNPAVTIATRPHKADLLRYTIHTKQPDGKFPVTYKTLTAESCSDGAVIGDGGRGMLFGTRCLAGAHDAKA